MNGAGLGVVLCRCQSSFVVVLARLCGLLLLLLSSLHTRVDLPSFHDRFLAAAEFVRRITDDGF